MSVRCPEIAPTRSWRIPHFPPGRCSESRGGGRSDGLARLGLRRHVRNDVRDGGVVKRVDDRRTPSLDEIVLAELGGHQRVEAGIHQRVIHTHVTAEHLSDGGLDGLEHGDVRQGRWGIGSRCSMDASAVSVGARRTHRRTGDRLRSGKPWPVKRTRSAAPHEPRAVSARRPSSGDMGASPIRASLRMAFPSRAAADMSPSSPLHARCRQTRMSIVASKGVQYCVGG